MTWIRGMSIAATISACIAGALAFDEYQASRAQADASLLSTVGAPFCAPQRSAPQFKTFFRLAMAQQDKIGAPPRTEVGPFSRAIATAGGAADASAEPVLAGDLGRLHYTITTAVPLAQQFFDQGLRLAYAFNHGEALRAFRKASALDPDCAMCYWGEGLVLGPNINAPMESAAVAPAFAAITRARALAIHTTPKERALIEALATRYAADVAGNRSALDQAYAQAMQSVAARYPDDDEVTVQYAEALMDLQPWDYWDAAGDPKGRAAEIVGLLKKVLERSPDHPGAIHYYIHLVEASADPLRALPYARRLGSLMPGAGHLVHMPFHIYFRAGLFKDALEANRAAVAADEALLAGSSATGIYPQAYYPHNVHSLLVSAQMAGDGKTVIDAAGKLEAIVSDAAARNIAWVQPIKAAPYFAHAQFSDLATILALPDPGADFPYVQAMWHYARAVGFANAGNTTAAQAEVDAIARLHESADFSGLIAGGVPAKDVVQLAQHVALGRIAQARRDYPAAVGHYSAAVAVEDTLAYSEPPYWYYPTRQSLGAALLLAGDLDRAEYALQSSLRRTPNNGWALFGLMKVYEQRKDVRSARTARELLRNAWVGELHELDLARL
jgi:tetratricopeptide (TPR) repeat protein